MNFPFGTVIRIIAAGVPVVLMVLGPNVGVCLIDLPWRYQGEVTEFALSSSAEGVEWEVLDGP